MYLAGGGDELLLKIMSQHVGGGRRIGQGVPVNITSMIMIGSEDTRLSV